MENEKEEYKIQRELNIRKVIILIAIIIAMVAIIVLFSVYIADQNFRKWVDINVLRKDILSENISTIDLNVEKNNQIYCYSKYICNLNDKNLKIYNSNGEGLTDIPLDINSALYASNDKYLAIAEKGGQDFFVILDKTYMWKQKVDGEILQIYINKNGYVALVTTDTTYKSIITVYDLNGTKILRNFLSSTRVVDVAISNDNKYVAYAEMDISGALIKSAIKIISVEKASISSEKATIYSKESDTSKLIIKIQYKEKGELVCVYDDSVVTIKDNKETEILEFKNNTTFISGNLSNSVAYIDEEQKGIFDSSSILNIINTQNNQIHTYNFEEIAKEMYTYDNIIGINIGTEIYFVNTNGMLVKKYTSNQEITNVIMSNEIAIAIYKDRIEIIKL